MIFHKALRLLAALLTVAMALTLIPGNAEADAPKLINFQGRLADGSGIPVADGSYSVTFRIYNVPAGGAALWSEIQSVSTTGGIFNVLLGSSTALPSTVFDDTTRYLAIQVSPDPEMTPRQRLSSVGYSLASEQWSSLGSNIFRLNGDVGIGTTSPSIPSGKGLDILSNSGHGGIAFKGSGGTATKFALVSTTFCRAPLKICAGIIVQGG